MQRHSQNLVTEIACLPTRILLLDQSLRLVGIVTLYYALKACYWPAVRLDRKELSYGRHVHTCERHPHAMSYTRGHWFLELVMHQVQP